MLAETSAAEAPREPAINPFSVYPVKSLRDLTDIIGSTFRSKEVNLVEEAIVAYAAGFAAGAEPQKLLLAAKGDFGTGKTHLLAFAREVLARESARFPITAGLGQPRARLPMVVTAVSVEASIEEWYAAELGPMLIAQRPRELVFDLLTEVASAQAEAEGNAEMAAGFRRSRKALFDEMRDPQELDTSEINRQFARELKTLCPNTNADFRKALGSLRRGEFADTVEEWLGGANVPFEDLARVGINPDGNRALLAANAILAIASLCNRLGRPFALFIDEFEHLARHDTRQGSRRNVTWLKRLIEALAARKAFVFVSGHWEAWQERSDLQDRFMGKKPLHLVRLGARDIRDIVAVKAPDWSGFSEANAETVVEATAGNIRRVMTLLYDLYGSAGDKSEPLPPDTIIEAALRRLPEQNDTDPLHALAQLAKDKAARMERKQAVGRTVFAAVVFKEGAPVLAVTQINAQDDLDLVTKAQAFARSVQSERAQAPRLRGLILAVGAVNAQNAKVLDAGFPETDVVNCEGVHLLEALAPAIDKALSEQAPVQDARAPEVVKALHDLNDLKREASLQYEAQRSRGARVFAEDERSTAIKAVTVRPPEPGAPVDLALRRTVYEKILASIDQWRSTALQASLFHARALSFKASALMLLCASGVLPYAYWLSDQPGNAVIVRSLVIAWLTFFVLFIYYLLLTKNQLDAYQKFQRDTIDRLYLFDDAPVAKMDHARQIMEEVFAAVGPRNAGEMARRQLSMAGLRNDERGHVPYHA